MPTQPYRNEAGDRVPGTTWVIGSNLGWNKDALKFWANREGLAGRNIRDRTNTAQKAADVGTVTHDMIETTLAGGDADAVLTRAVEDQVDFTDEMAARAREAFDSFRHWRLGSRLEVIATECWGVDEGYQTGFCADALGVEPDLDDPDKSHLTLIDWKTSTGTYADHVIQCAAYTVFIERMLQAGEMFCGGTILRPDLLEPFVGQPDLRLSGAHVLRVDKATGMFSHKHWSRSLLEQPWAAFTWCRSLHQVRWDIEKLTK